MSIVEGRTAIRATRDGLILAAACGYAPLKVWANNIAQVGFPKGLLLAVGIAWVMAILIRGLAVRAGADPERVTAALFWFFLGIGTTGWMVPAIPGGVWAATALLAAVSAIVYRLQTMPSIRWINSWMVVVVALTPFVLAASSYLGRGASQVEAASVQGPEIKADRDVIVLVFDAYGSPTVLGRDYSMGEDWVRSLEDRGLRVFPAMRANYSMTHVSLASFFRMDYPLEGGASIGEAEWADLLRTIDGDNSLVRAFASAGYRVVFVESAWSSIRCTRFVDTCIPGVWPDNATAIAIRKSVFGSAAPISLTESYAHGNRHSISWLENELEGVVGNGQPDLVIAHLLLPHPPLRLDASCSNRADGGQGGTILSWPSLSREQIEQRKRLYVDQVRCAASVLGAVADSVGDRAVLVAFGDHGPDSRLQLTTWPTDWSDQAIAERFGALFATNLDECDFGRAASLVNVGRVMLSCLGDRTIPLLEDRYFIVVEGAPLLELPAANVESPAFDLSNGPELSG